MATIKEGDLVCVYRRRKKGMGIVLEKIDDVIEGAGVDVTFDEVLLKLEEIGKRYNDRMLYKKDLRKRAQRPELVSACLLYNGQGWAKKPKKAFVRVRWFDRPSLYESNQTNTDEDWCPAEWLKKV